jgi:hypothetical protein
MVLDEETVKHIYNKVFGKQGEDFSDMAFELFDVGIVDWITQFTGEAMRLYDNGVDDWRESILYNDDVCCYVAIENYPSFFEAHYKDMDEIVETLKLQIGEYMPEGYDYRANIRHIIGTTWG